MTIFGRMMVVFAGVSLCFAIGVGCGGDEATQGDDAAATQTETERSADKAPLAAGKMPPMASDMATTIQEELKSKQELPDYYPEDGPLYPDTLPSNIRVKGSKVTKESMLGMLVTLFELIKVAAYQGANGLEPHALD